MNTDSQKSAQPCGCDEGADWMCEQHTRVMAEAMAAKILPSSPGDGQAIQDITANAAKAFVVKDSGERAQFESGMVRDVTTGKMRPDLAYAGPMFWRWVKQLMLGAVKYGFGNWLKASGPEELDRFLESANRHFLIWYFWRKFGINMEDMDHPTTKPLTEDHAAAVFFNINGTEYVQEGIDFANRK